MKINWEKKYIQMGVTAFVVIAASVLFAYATFHLEDISGALSGLFTILSPFIYAMIFVFLMVPIMGFFEQRFQLLLQHYAGRMRQTSLRLIARVLGILITVILSIFFLVLLVGMILPQLITSIVGFINDLPGYMALLEQLVSEFLENNPEISAAASKSLDDITAGLTAALPNINKMVSGIATGAVGVINVLKNILIGLVVSVYIMFSKETFVGQAKKLCFALMGTRQANTLLDSCRRIHRVFYGFITGKILDSAIIGVLCYIAMVVLKIPFALLVSVIIGVTNIIPFFGPIIGAVPCAIILFLERPLSGLYFIILIIVLQQLDGNVIGPKILGDSTGLSNFWIIFAIIMGGGLFGVPGMILGAPIFAVFYDFARRTINKRLEKKGITNDSEDFVNAAYVDPVSKKIIPKPELHVEPGPAMHLHKPNLSLKAILPQQDRREDSDKDH